MPDPTPRARVRVPPRRWASITVRLVIATAIAVAAVGLGAGGTADAHPLGNFTVNRYARVEVSGPVVRVYYVLDEAELPAFQDRKEVAAGEETFVRRRLAEIVADLSLQVDGRPLALTTAGSSLDQPTGQGGLQTLRVAAILAARLPDAPSGTPRRLTFADRNQPDRVGWREIVTVARGGARIVSTTAPTRDVSNELRRYPGDLISAPLDLRQADMTFVPGASTVAAEPVPASSAPPTRSGGLFASLITRQNLNPVVLAGMLAVALAVGAGHAVLPGHGKTVMAAYLVGTKGRPIDAVLLGVIVSVMHTASVLVLGLVLFRVDQSTSIDRFYPQLNVVSGVLAAGLGVWLLIGRLRRYRALRALDPADDRHDHDQLVPALMGAEVLAVDEGSPPPAHDLTSLADGGHDHDHHDHDDHHDHHHHGPGGHTHELPADVAPLSRRGLVLLATSGGVVPSPTAVIVVVSAFSLGRPALGLTLIAAFSIGLAVTLTAVGLALVFGRRFIERRFSLRSFELLPTLGALTLIVLGLVLAVRGLAGGV